MYPVGESLRYVLGRRPQNRCENSGKKKYFCPFGEWNSVVHPVRNHYADWAIPAKQALGGGGGKKIKPSNGGVTKIG